ncbi:hypothetical protein ACHAP8_004990 [Fusarium lateritium]
MTLSLCLVKPSPTDSLSDILTSVSEKRKRDEEDNEEEKKKEKKKQKTILDFFCVKKVAKIVVAERVAAAIEACRRNRAAMSPESRARLSVVNADLGLSGIPE